MAYAKFDDGFADHPKVRGLSTGAFRLHVTAVLRCVRYRQTYLADSYVRTMVRKWRAKDARELVEAGLWVREGNGYHIKDVHSPRQISRPAIPRQVRYEVMRRDQYMCRICGTGERLTVDHIVPFSHGGPDTVENLRVLCQWCNARRGAGRLTDEQLKELA